MKNVFKIKKYRIITLCMMFFSLASFAQEYSDKTTGFDATRITLALKKRGLTDQSIQQEVTLMRKLHNQQYAEIKKSEDEILQKITSELTLKAETNTPVNIPVNTASTAKSASTLKTASTLATDIPQTEKDALLALYNSTNGNNWTNKTGWNFSNPVTSAWYGVTVTNGHVTSINLSNNNLNGTISAAIGQLTQLQALYLYQNQLSGTIPNSIGQLIQLHTLHLYTNQLSGTIPVEIGQLTKLTSLYLHQNQLSGTIPNSIGLLTKLVNLFLHQNQLTGTIPLEIGQLTQLQILSLYSNQLSGTIPASIGQLIKLQYLYLNNNQLTGAIPSEIQQLINILNITLGNNQLSGTIPSGIGLLTKLTTLYLYSNQLTGIIPAEIGQLTQLQNLHLYANQLSGTIPATIGQLTQLQTLYLNNNQLSGTIPNSIGQLIKLTRLYFHNNQLTGTIPTTIGQLTEILEFYLYNNQLSGSIPSEIKYLTKIQNINLQTNQLTGAIPTGIKHLINIQNINLSFNQLSGAIPTEIGLLTKLISINLMANQLSGTIPNSIGQLSKLTSLYLHSNQLTGVIPVEIRQLVLLQMLYLNNNQLTGTIPAEISQLVNIQQINLSSNQLSGVIPYQIGLLKKLTFLQIHNNQFSGTIPTTIGQLTEVQNLALNNNKLTGSIPVEIGQLTKITRLYLHNNLLSGTIPTQIGQLSQLLELYLYSNQLSGTIPAVIGQLTQLQLFHLYNNKLEGNIPNLINVASSLSFHTNKFRFVDFASQFSAYKTKLTLFEYSNQAKTDTETTITKTVGETQTLTMYEDNRFTPADTYQWYKNGTAISGATSRQYTLTNLTVANAGDYYCISRNPQMTITTVTNQNLVLTRNTIHLNVNNCNAVLSSAAGTNAQTICASAAITPITYTTAGLITGATFSGLPAGVTGNFASNTVTISGTPAAEGTFAYTVTYTGSCGSTVTSKGTITIQTKTVNAASATPFVCINTAIVPIVHTTSGGILTVGTPSGLPSGVTAVWASNILTITGIPTTAGIFNYSIPLLGGCGDTLNATGTITVSTPGTIMLSSAAGTDNQSKNINTALTPITYATTGTTGAGVTGLPAGVTGSFASNTVTITGTPAVSGTFNYLVTLTGECNTIISGKITSLCEPITGVIKIITEPVQTSYPFQFSESGTLRSSACNKTGFPNTFYAATATLSVGTILYTNEALTIPLTNGNFWYKNQANATAYKVNSSGKIVMITACGSDPDSGPGYAFQFSQPRLQRDCGAITFPVTYYAATNYVSVGTKLYTSKSLTTPLGGGYWVKLADSNSAYLIGSGGILSSEVTCGMQ